MQKLAIISGALNRVADGVSEIENRAFAGLVALVLLNDFRFYLDIAPNKLL